jgi:hypothetical protein
MRHVIALAALCSTSLFAQEFRSTLSGLVTDPQGAAVSGAKVRLRETATNTGYEATSAVDGAFTLPFVPPGDYELSAEASGFKKYVQAGIRIGTNQRLSQNITLSLGAITESITVSADVSQLNTSSASVGQVISTAQLDSMPMNGRTPLSLAQLAFGVVPASDPRFTRPFDNAGPSGFSMGGGQGQSNEILLDGAPDMTRNRRVAYNPPADSVAEVKVEVFQSDAAYGNTGGGTVNVVMKGGANDFHGSAYLFNQVSALKANQFFSNAANQARAVTRFNQYGLTASGPVVIPKLFNGKNKVFWYFAYEGIKQSEPEPTFSTVPTDAQRGGNLSQLLSVNAIYQIYDPLTGAREGARVRRQPFPNNVIPANRINPVARNILGLIPGPNTTGGADGINNYFNNAVRSDDFFSYLGRLDVNASDKHKFFFSYRINDRLEDRGRRFGTPVTGNFLSRVNNGATFDDVYTLSPSMLLNTRLNWTRFTEGSTRPHDGFDFTSLGFPQYMAAASARNVIPFVDFSNFTDIGDSGGDSTPFDSFQIFTTLTKITGKHSIKTGIDIRQQRESSNGFGNSSGRFVFNNSYTRGPLDNSPGAPLGQDLGSFLLGVIGPDGNSNFDVNASRTQQAKYISTFIQDDWRVRSNLTLNLGIRYEIETGTTERFNRTTVGFDDAAVNSTTAAARAAYARNPNAAIPAANFNPTGGVIFADANRRSIYDPPNYAVSPRFGMSWSPAKLGGKTVIRGGAGVFYSTYGTTGVLQPGFSQRTPVPANELGDLSQPTAYLNNPFPRGILQPVGSSLGVNTFLGQNVSFLRNKVAQPMTWRWSFNIQRELGRNFLLETGYIGSVANRLTEGRDLNFIPLSFLSESPIRDQDNINRVRANIPNPFAGLLPGTNLNGNSISLEQLLRPYPQFAGQNGVRAEGENNGFSNFHMFQVQLQKRFSKGLSFMTNFQRSKMIEATGRLNAADPFLERRIAEEDRPYRFVASGMYELPFGKGKSLVSNANGFVDAIIGGWQMNVIYTNQAGPTVAWGNVIYNGGDLQWNAHPKNAGNLISFDRTRFNTNNAQQLDLNRRTFNSRFSDYRADTINNVDFSVLKNFKLFERVTAQLRGEAFNLMNRVSFNGPDVNPTSANFGRITGQANLNRAVQLALRFKW